MKKEYVLFIIIGILIVFLSFVITQNIINKDNENRTIETSNNNTVKKQNIEKQNEVPNGEVGIVSHKYNGNGSIEVVIKNNTKQDLKKVQITAHCWDKNGNNLGDKLNSEYNINTKDTYKIKIWCGIDMNKYKLELSYK